jgi:hypothetical protein
VRVRRRLTAPYQHPPHPPPRALNNIQPGRPAALSPLLLPHHRRWRQPPPLSRALRPAHHLRPDLRYFVREPCRGKAEARDPSPVQRTWVGDHIDPTALLPSPATAGRPDTASPDPTPPRLPSAPQDPSILPSHTKSWRYPACGCP